MTILTHRQCSSDLVLTLVERCSFTRAELSEVTRVYELVGDSFGATSFAWRIASAGLKGSLNDPAALNLVRITGAAPGRFLGCGIHQSRSGVAGVISLKPDQLGLGRARVIALRAP